MKRSFDLPSTFNKQVVTMPGRGISSRRSDIEIVSDMLSACEKRAVSNWGFMTANRLSYTQVTRYVSVLLTKELIEENAEGRFSITDGGKKSLRTLKRALKVIKALRDT